VTPRLSLVEKRISGNFSLGSGPNPPVRKEISFAPSPGKPEAVGKNFLIDGSEKSRSGGTVLLYHFIYCVPGLISFPVFSFWKRKERPHVRRLAWTQKRNLGCRLCLFFRSLLAITLVPGPDGLVFSFPPKEKDAPRVGQKPNFSRLTEGPIHPCSSAFFCPEV